MSWHLASDLRKLTDRMRGLSSSYGLIAIFFESQAFARQAERMAPSPVILVLLVS